MAKYEALQTLTILPARTVLPGEMVELDDCQAIILLEKQCIQPATSRGQFIQTVELEEWKDGTNDE